ncbi:MAG: polyphosphate polymerase domain-containing protein [Bacteroidetes bacterium]|nr:polyphosphate polymerase domain-containing protein [Bacteroidota bacterium]MBU1114906.1 polyphosphate polymerase domain-containing protein [Bacteroidota bacterium]MBU1799384.1 polyphosphate polymerase domain-containing protein [Bacteroidota bacterium]
MEYKYIVPISQIDSLRQQMLPYLEYDPNSKNFENKHYTVKSIYLDSSNLKDYHDKIESINRRKKVRIRGYNNIDSCSKVFLELKKKIGSHVYKNRALISYCDLEDFLSNRNYDLIESKKYKSDAEKFLYHYTRGSLNPITLVTYEREAFFSKFDNTLRITFDKNIRFQKAANFEALSLDHQYEAINHDFFVLEIKFSKGFPDWLQNILFAHKLTRKSFSKYAESVDSLINLSSSSFSTELKHRNIYV